MNKYLIVRRGCCCCWQQWCFDVWWMKMKLCTKIVELVPPCSQGIQLSFSTPWFYVILLLLKVCWLINVADRRWCLCCSLMMAVLLFALVFALSALLCFEGRCEFFSLPFLSVLPPPPKKQQKSAEQLPRELNIIIEFSHSYCNNRKIIIPFYPNIQYKLTEIRCAICQTPGG